MVKTLLKEAADTLRRLPMPRIRAAVTKWPDVVQDTVEALYTTGERPRLAAPMPAAIDRMELCLVWLLACSIEQRRVIWARACGVPWRRLEDMDGRSHVTLRKIEDQGLRMIMRYLRAHPELATRVPA